MNKSIVTVVYSHGRFGSPWFGTKIEALRPVALELGANILSIRYPEEDSVERMESSLLDLVRDDVRVPGDLVFLSSSRGAYISTRVSQTVENFFASEGTRRDDDIVLPPRRLIGSFLIAPAFYIKPDYYPDQDPSPSEARVAIVHGHDDKVIDVQNSITFARKHNTELFLLPGGHRMNSQISNLRVLFKSFLQSRMEESQEHFDKWRQENAVVRETGDDISPKANKGL